MAAVGQNGTSNRRRYPRFACLSHAWVIGEDQKAQPCALEDLSLGGARLIAASQLVIGENIQVMLQLPGLGSVRVCGRVVRRFGPQPHGERRFGDGAFIFGVAFTQKPHSGVLDALNDNPGHADVVSPGDDGAILVVGQDGTACSGWVREILHLGRRAIAVTTALDAIEWLIDSGHTFFAALIDIESRDVDGIGLLHYLADEFPEVRRIGVGEPQGLILPARTLGLRHTFFCADDDRDHLRAALTTDM